MARRIAPIGAAVEEGVRRAAGVGLVQHQVAVLRQHMRALLHVTQYALVGRVGWRRGHA